MSIDRALVMHVAGLARLELSEDEIAHYQTQLARILDYVQMLEATPGAGMPALLPPFERPDLNMPSLTHEQALAQAPERRDGAFQVPKIIE